MTEAGHRVSVVIPARNAAKSIRRIVRAVLAQGSDVMGIEVIVVDDGSVDGTRAAAEAAGAKVLASAAPSEGGNPAAARNRGAAVAGGDPLVFLDADCLPGEGWLEALRSAHAAGALCVGGSLALPPSLPATARWDYYCGWYHVHPLRPPGVVPNHPPANLSVRAETFRAVAGFTERGSVAYAHEELAWQGELRRAGIEIHFEPAALAYHENRPGFGNLLRRNYRWGYSAIESKAETGAARLAWLYRYPRTLMVLSFPLAVVQAAYIVGCWLRVGVVEPLLVFPAVLAARFAYATGTIVGTLRWLRRFRSSAPAASPRWT